MKNDTEVEKPQGAEGAWFGSGKQGIKKKPNNKHKSHEPHTAGEFFKAVGFSVGPHRPEMYLKTKQKISLYASMKFKNGSDVTIFLLEEKLVKPKVPILEDEHTAHRMGKLMKTEKILEGNLCSLFMILMSLCDSTTKNQVENTSKYPKLEKRLDSLGPLSLIRRLAYMGGMNDLDMRHNKATALLNLRNLHQEKFQHIQNFRD